MVEHSKYQALIRVHCEIFEIDEIDEIELVFQGLDRQYLSEIRKDSNQPQLQLEVPPMLRDHRKWNSYEILKDFDQIYLQELDDHRILVKFFNDLDQN